MNRRVQFWRRPGGDLYWITVEGKVVRQITLQGPFDPDDYKIGHVADFYGTPTTCAIFDVHLRTATMYDNGLMPVRPVGRYRS